MRAWVGAAALTALGLGGLEAMWRQRGFVPSPPDDPSLWCLARGEVGPRTLALVGTSRIQSDVVAAVLAEELSRPVVQLGILGASPLPILDELAADESFRGSVVVDVIPRIVFDAAGWRETLPRRYLQACREMGPGARLETRLETWVGTRLALRNPGASLAQVLIQVGRGLPPPPFWVLGADRTRWIDFRLTDLAATRQGLEAVAAGTGDPATPAEADAIRGRIERAVERIHARGGRVALVQFPTSGGVRELEETRFPRERYWDPLARGTAALAIRADEVPALASFPTPDGSHIDGRDTAAFSRALARVLRRAWPE